MYGYFHCAIAGGMERIMKLGHGFDSRPPLAVSRDDEGRLQFCGHFLSDSFKERWMIGTDVSPETVSKSWQSAYETWEVEGDVTNPNSRCWSQVGVDSSASTSFPVCLTSGTVLLSLTTIPPVNR